MAFYTVKLGTASFRKYLALSVLVLIPELLSAQAYTPFDFGSTALNTPKTQVLSFSFTGLSQAPTFSLHYSLDFTASAPVCTPDRSSCSLSINFSPTLPGVRQDRVLMKNAAGTVIATQSLHGIGLGANIAYLPKRDTTDYAPYYITPRVYGGVVSGMAGEYYFSIASLHEVFKFDPAAGFYAATVYAGNYPGQGYSGDTGVASAASLNSPAGLALDSGGNLYIADRGNHVVRRVDANTQIITTVAGNGVSGYTGDGGPAVFATLASPNALAIDLAGNIFIADSAGHVIRRVDAVTGNISTVAGMGTAGFTGDNSSALLATLNAPSGIAVDPSNNLLIADAGNHVVREVTAADGTIKTIAGSGSAAAYQNDGLDPLQANLSPVSVAINTSGNVLIGEGSAIRELTIDRTSILTAMQTPGPITAIDSNANGLFFATTNRDIFSTGTQKSGYGGTSTVVGSAKNFSVLLQNSGSAALDLSHISISGTSATEFSQTNDCGGSVTPGAFCNLSIRFTPIGQQFRSATLSVSDDPRFAAYYVSLSGYADPSLTVRPYNVSLGNVNIGQSSLASSTIQNVGEVPVALSNAVFTPLYGGPIQFTQTNNCNGSIAPHSSCQVTVTFAPTQSGSAWGTFAFSYGANTDQTISFSVAGTGLEIPSIKLSDTSMDFASRTIGTISFPPYFSVYNNTAVAVTLGVPTISGPAADEFSSFNNCGSALAAGATCSVYVIFTPARLGSQAASIAITDSVSGVHSVALTGTGALPTTFEIVNGATGKALAIQDANDGTVVQQSTLSEASNESWRAVSTSDGYYRIESVATGKVLDVTGASQANGAMIQQYAYLASDNQQWQFVSVDSVHFKIVNKATGKVLDLPGGSRDDGTPIQQWDFNGNKQQVWTLVPTTAFKFSSGSTGKVLGLAKNDTQSGTLIQQRSYAGLKTQHWQFVAVDAGYFAIFNLGTGKALDVTAASIENGALVQQYDFYGSPNQQWQILPVDTSGRMKIINRASGKALDLAGNSASDGTLVQQWDYLGARNQAWLLTTVQYAAISNFYSGKVLDLPGGSTQDGTPIQQWSFNNLPQQTWELVSVDTRNYAIINRASGKALEVAGSSTANGATVQQSAYTGADNQQWQLVSVGPIYYFFVNKQSGKVLDGTGFSRDNGTVLQQYQLTNGTNQMWFLR